MNPHLCLAQPHGFSFIPCLNWWQPHPSTQPRDSLAVIVNSSLSLSCTYYQLLSPTGFYYLSISRVCSLPFIPGATYLFSLFFVMTCYSIIQHCYQIKLFKLSRLSYSMPLFMLFPLPGLPLSHSLFIPQKLTEQLFGSLCQVPENYRFAPCIHTAEGFLLGCGCLCSICREDSVKRGIIYVFLKAFPILISG